MAQSVNDPACLCGVAGLIPKPGQQVKDPELLQLWQRLHMRLTFHPWAGTFPVAGGGEKKKKKGGGGAFFFHFVFFLFFFFFFLLHLVNLATEAASLYSGCYLKSLLGPSLARAGIGSFGVIYFSFVSYP